MATTAELMRTCAPLYPSFALESAASLTLFCFFSYLSILISSKFQLKAPARTLCKFFYLHVVDWAVDTRHVLSRWPHMHEMDMGQRFRFCRRLNATICRISAFNALISITRWLHVNNVNGFRYLSYAITCPLMQAELVLMIAPIVPCYRIVVVLTCLVTFVMLVSGYAASQFDGSLFETDWHDILIDGNFHNLTTKGWLICPSVVVLSFLSLVQLPVLGLMYFCKGGSSSGELPHGYPKLLLLTSITWWGFPAWWMLSYEGMSIIKDTWANGLGFVTLNMISKGGFTLQVLSMVKHFKRQHAAQLSAQQDEPDASRCSRLSRVTLPPLPGDLEGLEGDRSPVRRGRAVTQTSLNWFVDYMKQYEDGQQVSSRPKAAEMQLQSDKSGTVTIVDASALSSDDLLQELARRLGSGHAPTVVAYDQQESFEKTLDIEIARACAQLAMMGESDDEEDE